MAEIEVGMGEFKLAKSPDSLMAVGVGSCVVIALYAPGLKIGGLAHTLAIELSLSVDKMLQELEAAGISRTGLTAKLIGGANMFGIYPDAASTGHQNVLAAREKLEKEGIKIVAESVGGFQGRSVEFSLRDGTVSVKTIL